MANLIEILKSSFGQGIKLLPGILIILIVGSCQNEIKRFNLLDADRTGITFENHVFGEDEIDIFKNYFYYNGAGVTVADFDNDGLQDVLFTGNHVPSRLYKNLGDLKFMDITEKAGLLSDSWATGATFGDVNADGLKDIYICTVGDNEPNLFYLNRGLNNKGVVHFEEKGEEFGINAKNVSVHAAFFDYDKDDDLDLVVAVNSQVMNHRNNILNPEIDPLKRTNELLYKNNGSGKFSQVSDEAGLIFEGSSLGVAVNDINNDGWPDIYVSNDFISSDIVYINNQNGTFTNKTNAYIRHSSFSSMGVDVADVNQDGLMDVTVMDMLPVSNRRRKMMLAPINYDLYENRARAGYNTQFGRNTLQLNQGVDQFGDVHFSEIACLARIYSTDWSWAPLWADYDNDGLLDLYVTNGYPRDITDLDHILGLEQYASVGTQESQSKHRRDEQKQVPAIIENNFMFKNQGKLEMAEVTGEYGLDNPSISHGVAFADLDNDGDLEIVVNNFAQQAFVYQNNTMQMQKAGQGNFSNFLKVKLTGKGKNLDAFGTSLIIYCQGKEQHYYHSAVRGYMSSMGDIIHMGIGKYTSIDSIRITWPDLKKHTIYNVDVNKLLAISYTGKENNAKEEDGKKLLFKDATRTLNLIHKHQENNFIDYKNEPLFQKMYSREGPALAVGDVNGDGADDLFVGGAMNKPSYFFLQNETGFAKSNMLPDSLYEDMGTLLFDVDNDQDLDLYVASGGSEFGANSEQYQDRLYINDGQANFSLSASLPAITSSGGPVKGADYDKDGDIDLFVGGKIIMGQYPSVPRSYILTNENGLLTDKTPSDLEYPGMVTDALWTDFDNDSWIDLVVVGEWMEVSFFKNHQGQLKKYEDSGISNSSGWWNSIAGGDFDKDGDIDYILGNLGSNSSIEASAEEPVRLYAGDFDKNEKIDPVLSHYIKDDFGQRKEFVLHTRDALADQIIGFKRRFNNYSSFAGAELGDVITEKEKEGISILEAGYLKSAFMENLGNGQFELHELPEAAQVAPVNAILIEDINEDGFLDAILTGNIYSSEPLFGRYDASLGTCLLGQGQGVFHPLPATESGLYLKGDQKSAVSMSVNDDYVMVFGVNSGNLMAVNYAQQKTTSEINLASTDVCAIIEFQDGSQMKHEFYLGNSYLSQSHRKFRISENMKEVKIYDSRGGERKVK